MLQPEGFCALVIGLVGIGITTGVIASDNGLLPAFLSFIALALVFVLGGIFGRSITT